VQGWITSLATIGNITAKIGGLTNYMIAAGADPAAGVYHSFYANAAGKDLPVKIGTITVAGDVEGTSIAAGIDPGLSGIYGDIDDVIATAPAGAVGKTKIGAMKFDTKMAVTDSFNSTPAFKVDNAFEAQALTSIQLGKARRGPGYLGPIVSTSYLDTADESIVVRLI
jgi:hypothetical protein